VGTTFEKAYPAMSERGVIPDNPTTPNGNPAIAGCDNGLPEIELRVRRLEDAVATLQDTKRIEERVMERVARRLRRESVQATAPETGEGVVNIGRKILPAALTLVQTEADRAERQATPTAVPRKSWFLIDAYAEARAMVRMFLDPRYRTSWQARVFPLTLAGLILTSWIWLPGTALLPASLMTIVDKVVDVVLAFLAYKILSREVRLYRETVADLPVPSRP
jgi:hypothetical protein